MASKRRNESTDFKPRKTCRTLLPPARLKFRAHESLPQKLSQAPNVEHGGITLGEISEYIQRYNTLISFMPSRQVDDSRVKETHRQMLDAIANINKIVTPVIEEVNACFGQIQACNERMFRPSVGFKRWYQTGDVFDLEPDQLNRILRSYPIEDAKDFSDYLLRTVSPHLQLEPGSRDGLGPRIQRLSDVLSRSPDPAVQRYSLAFLVEFLALLWPKQTCLQGYEKTDLEKALWKSLRLHLYTADPDLFYGFAAVRRTLWTAYSSDMSCDSNVSWSGQCLHQKWIGILEELQRRSILEIRSKVSLAAGRELPPKLAETVLEYALEAEGIPVDSEVGEADPERPGSYELRKEYNCGRDAPGSIIPGGRRTWGGVDYRAANMPLL